MLCFHDDFVLMKFPFNQDCITKKSVFVRIDGLPDRIQLLKNYYIIAYLNQNKPNISVIVNFKKKYLFQNIVWFFYVIFGKHNFVKADWSLDPKLYSYLYLDFKLDPDLWLKMTILDPKHWKK